MGSCGNAVELFEVRRGDFHFILCLKDAFYLLCVGFAILVGFLIAVLRKARNRRDVPLELPETLSLAGVHVAVVDCQARFTGAFFGTMPILHLDQIVGKRGEQIFPCDGQRMMTALRLKAMETGHAQSACIPDLIGVDSAKSRSCQATVVPLRGQNGSVQGAVSVVVDVSAQKLAEEEVQRKIQQLVLARENAEKAAVAKAEFLSVMSHELRTPMNGVIGMAQLLKATSLDTVQREYLRIILISGGSLLRIIDSILDFSKLESGKLILENCSFAVGSVVQDVVDIVAPHATQQHDKIVTTISQEVPAVLVGDAHRIFQVLLNLVTNACKFTQKGTITITVVMEPKPTRQNLSIKTEKGLLTAESATDVDMKPGEEKNSVHVKAAKAEQVEMVTSDMQMRVDVLHGVNVTAQQATFEQKDTESVTVQVSVKDTGIGIKAEVQTQLFLPFTQADQSTTRMFGGTGLGLAICKKLVMLMRGRIGVSSKFGEGSEFWFTVPLRRPAAASENIPTWSTPKSVSTPIEIAAEMAPTNVWDKAGTGAVAHVTDLKPTEGRAAAKPSDRQRSRVLLAEDNLINQKVAVHMLNRLGYDCDVVGDGQAAVDTVRDAPDTFCAVLMDAQMPVKDGETATREIRALEQANKNRRRLVIIALTADVLVGSREKYIRGGFDGYLPKPVALEQLKEALARSC